MAMTTRCTLLLALLLACVASVSCGVMREYNKLERVPILVNNVGPFNNPAEVYPYYDLPFCSPKFQHDHDGALGETLAGDRRRSSLYDLRFGVPIQWQALCHFRLSQDEIRRFIDAINNHYIFEIFVDELPVKGFVGEVELSSHKVDSHVHNESSIYLFTHLDFSVAYNGNTIIACNLTTDPEQRVKLVFGQDIDVEFSYSTQWVETNVPWVDRMEHHQKSAIGDQSVEIHWLSIINSFVLVVLLTAFLAIILMHVLKKDIARYMELDPEDFDESGQDDSGWKRVHGDVFRPPQNVMLFSAIIGNGAQMLVLIVSVLLLSLVGTFYPGNRGAVYTALIVLYFVTSFIAGYTATTIFVQLGGSKWASNAVLTACLFAIPFFTVFCFVNSVAISYGSTSALPLSTIVSLFLAWALLALPLTIGGSVRAKNKKPTFDAPCKTNKAEREIPPTAWYRSAPVQMFIAGFLPFSAIYIELHYIFASVWGHRAYTLFGILSLAFLMLIIVTAFITIALTYFQLAVEDYRWWWRAFLSGASTGVFMYAYAAFYFMYRSEMSGVLQGSFFFGYMLVISYAFSLMLGAVSYWMAQKFVKHIYHNIKIA